MRQKFNVSAEERKDVYQRVTDTIVAQLENGVRPWAQPWEGGKVGTRPLRHNAIAYTGVNVLMLWAAAMDKGYETPYWMTYNQSVEYGAHVRKGEKGSLVVYANSVTKKEHDDATGEDTERNIPFLKGYTVFNADQIEGLPAHYYANPPPKREPLQRLAHADAYIAATGAAILYGGGRAYYAEQDDHIRMPKPDVFENPEQFYATELHELTHWTKHPRRLAREFGRKAWGDAGYAQEELVAELASAFLCADLEITPDVREDHAAYIQSWLKALKDDKRHIFQAAAHAQRAVDYLHRLQPASSPEPPSITEGGYIVLSAEGITARHAPVSSADEASAAWRRFIEENCLGASDITGDSGFIYSNDKQLVAKLSYNGRVWTPGGELLQEAAPWPEPEDGAHEVQTVPPPEPRPEAPREDDGSAQLTLF